MVLKSLLKCSILSLATLAIPLSITSVKAEDSVEVLHWVDRRWGGCGTQCIEGKP